MSDYLEAVPFFTAMVGPAILASLILGVRASREGRHAPTGLLVGIWVLTMVLYVPWLLNGKAMLPSSGIATFATVCVLPVIGAVLAERWSKGQHFSRRGVAIAVYASGLLTAPVVVVMMIGMVLYVAQDSW